MTQKKVAFAPMTDLTLDDCMHHHGKLPSTQEWFEIFGYSVLGEMQDYDFHLFTGFNILKGPPGGGHWMVEDNVLNHTTFIMLPKENRGRITDNDFVTGENMPWQYLKGSDLKVTKEEDRVVWKGAEKEFIGRPPYWEAHGSHLGLDFDLTARSICPGFWFVGHFSDLSKTKASGVDELIQVEGTITVKGKKYEVTHAGGLHEHVAFVGYDQVGPIAQVPYYWCEGWSEEIQFHMFYTPAEMFPGSARVVVGGKVFLYEGSQVSLTERQFWVDPLTGLLTSIKWQLHWESPEGIFDAVVVSSGRAFQAQTLRSGFIWRYWNLAIANGSFASADGKVVPIKDVRVAFNRATAFDSLRWNSEEGLDRK